MAVAGDKWPCTQCGVMTVLVEQTIMVEGKPVLQLVCGCGPCHGR